MIRFLLRRIPRFGFVTLFAAMLLFVSVAGWAKWNLELWQEEEALLADLANAGVAVTYKRDFAGHVETKPNPGTAPPARTLWSSIVPFASRIESLHLQDSAPGDLLERAAALPYVRQFYGDVKPAGAAKIEAIAAKAEFDFQPPPAPVVTSDVAPLPQGEPLDGPDAEAALVQFTRSRRTLENAPTRGTAHSVAAIPGTNRRFYARDDALRFGAYDGAIGMTAAESHTTFIFDGARFRQNSRIDAPEITEEMFARESPPLIVFDERTYFDTNLEKYGIQASFKAALDTTGEIRVERIDDRRVRFDLPPIVQDFPAADCEDSLAISLIARSDLDWALEAWDMQGARKTGAATPANLPQIASASYRGTLRREGDWIVAEEWVADWLAGSATPLVPGQPAHLVPVRASGVARYDFTSDLDLSHVTPELFDAELLPPQRKLPWLRWHRVTLALSLGLFAFVAARRLVARRRSAEAPTARSLDGD